MEKYINEVLGILGIYEVSELQMLRLGSVFSSYSDYRREIQYTARKKNRDAIEQMYSQEQRDIDNMPVEILSEEDKNRIMEKYSRIMFGLVEKV